MADSNVQALEEASDCIVKLKHLPSSQPTTIHSLASHIIKVIGAEAKIGSLNEDAQETAQKRVKREWMEQQLENFVKTLLKLVQAENAYTSSIAFRTIMTVVLIDWKYKNNFASTTPGRLFAASIEAPSEVFCDEWVTYLPFNDVRYFFLKAVTGYTNDKGHKLEQLHMDRLISVMLSLRSLSEDNLNNLYSSKIRAVDIKRCVSRLGPQKKAFQQAWQAILMSNISLSQLKSVMSEFHTALLPNFEQPKLFMDFLTDAYNHGGSIALLALNSIFFLIQQHGLDYSKFYEKLYALLENGDVLYSRHRARFLRLLSLFLSSSHLPATIVASMLKRLARLALFAPPGALAAVLPFVYNQLKTTRACMVMIHRMNDITGADCDPFDDSVKDPIKTGAIDSSLWELNALVNHYQPNIAAIAKVFSLPFRKPQYQLDHFLSHSYETLFATEMGRKWNPEVPIEFEQLNILGGDLDDSSVMIQSNWTI